MGDKLSNIKSWTRAAQIAGAFAFVISILLIVNYVQYKRIDPVETELINNLITRLNQNPDDFQLREEIRALDLLSRKAYFTNQWQVRTGGYLLLISIAILVIAMQIIKGNSGKEITIGDKENNFIEKKNARKWISIGGTIIVFTALTFAFLTHNDLSKIPISEELTEKLAENVNIAETDNDIIITEQKNVNIEEPEAEQIKPNNTEIAESKEVIPKKVVEEKTIKKKIKPITNKSISEYPTEKEIENNHPAFRGSGGNGISYHKNIPTIWNGTTGDNILWKLKIPLHGFNSPIVWGDKVFVSGAVDDKREVYCIDGNTGVILWTFDVKNIPGSPAKLPQVTDDTGLAAPTLTTDGRRVYAIFGNGDLVAIDMKGEQVWARNLGDPGNHYGHSSSLMLFQNILILQYDTKKSPKLLGLSTKSGETLWSTDRKVRISWASPIVVVTGNKTEIIIASDPIVASYNPLTGKENWQVDCIFGEVGPSPAYADGIVFAVNEYAKLVAIKIGPTPEIIWENDEYLSDVPSPVATKELLFMATSYGAVVCYDAKTGEKYWEQEFDNGFYSSPILADGKIYLMDMEGIMHIFKAENEYEQISESPIGEKGMTTPAFADGKIYVRGNDYLYCIGR